MSRPPTWTYAEAMGIPVIQREKPKSHIGEPVPARRSDPAHVKAAARVNRNEQAQRIAAYFREHYERHGELGLTNYDIKEHFGFAEMGDFSSRVNDLWLAGIICKAGTRKPAPDRREQQIHVWVPVDERQKEEKLDIETL